MKFAQYASDMRELDRHTIEDLGVPSEVLMERAALAVADAAEELLGASSQGLVAAVCGVGNNGGDGAAAARILKNRGIRTAVVFIGDREKISPDMRKELILARNFGVTLLSGSESIPENAAVYIDALFGIGLAREVGGDYALAIRKMNEAPGRVVAADIPSGIAADTGEVLGTAVNADITVTMQRGKPGLFLDPGRQYAGEVRIADIGIFAPSCSLTNAAGPGVQEASPDNNGDAEAGNRQMPPAPPIFLFENEDFAKLLPKRLPSGNKGTFGKIVLIAGSMNMAGAAVLAARAALRAGAGMVKIVAPACNREILQISVPEALLATYTAENYADVLKEALRFGNVIAAGPGLGAEPETVGMIKTLLTVLPDLPEKPSLVLDAGALNIIAAEKLMELVPEGAFLTPHIVEMTRLSGLTAKEIIRDRLKAAENFAKTGDLRLLLKDARTVIVSDGRSFINLSGTDGMAAAGSGDVLTGILAGLLAQHTDESFAGPAAAFLHGCAGEKAAEALGRRSMTAADICEYLPDAFRELTDTEF